MLASCALAVVCACSKPAPSSMLGHWRAERVSVFSAKLPIGPDIVVGEREISSPDADMSVSVKGFEAKAGEVTVDLAYGLGLTFYFDGPDRVYLKVPLVGKVYYRRVVDNVAAVAVAPTASAVRASSAEAVAVPVVRSTSESSVAEGRPAAEFQLASTAARQGQADAAIDHLNMAFKAGFRDFGLLNASSEFSSLTSDVRYQALIARYR